MIGGMNIGELAISGDRACVNGELEALGELVRRVSESAKEPLHCELVAFADLCETDSVRASNEWPRVRELIRGSAR
jgi:hypothetical protein